MANLARWLRGAVLAIFVLQALIFTSSSAAESDFVHVDELVDVIKTKDIDLIVRTLNKVKSMSYQGEILVFLKNVWNDKKDTNLDIPWDVLDFPIIRLEIANIMLQAERNRRIRIDPSVFREYSLAYLDSQDIRLVQVAVFNLAIADNEADVDDILELAKKLEPGTFRISVIALSEMCNSKSGEALDDLEKFAPTANLKSYVVETRREFMDFKKGFCSRKL